MSNTDDISKKLLKAPKLPDTVQGDGRYVMRLLKKYLEQQAIQLNLANGFTAKEIKGTSAGDTPKHFILTFDRLGGHFTWDYPNDITTVAYYELRTNTNVGSKSGLLERTYENKSDKLPNAYAATVYLYAVNTARKASNPSVLSYTKARPYAPSEIALTKNNEGVLITFLDIPSDCIGANIYINGKKYTSLDNVYLYSKSNKDQKIRRVEVAYYDSFGEGERAVLDCFLPDVTGFLVERNGANLDFYWEPVDVYDASYEVRVAASADWNTGLKLFTTKTNNKNRYIYPNEGQYYLLVKAFDAHGNYSENAAYQIMNTYADISRNVILEFNQNDVDYPGDKLNMYYDYAADNITLEREATFGEYMMNVQLPKQYRARNWLSFECQAYTEDSVIWNDAEYTWDDANGAWNGSIVEDALIDVKQEIAIYTGVDTQDVFTARENSSITPETGGSVLENQNASSFDASHFGNGVVITPTTLLSYITDLPQQFKLLFTLKTEGKLPDTILMTLAYNTAKFIYIGFDATKDCFYMRCSDGKAVTIDRINPESVSDWITFGISQSGTERALYIHSLAANKISRQAVNAAPLAAFNKIYCYPKIINA